MCGKIVRCELPRYKCKFKRVIFGKCNCLSSIVKQLHGNMKGAKDMKTCPCPVCDHFFSMWNQTAEQLSEGARTRLEFDKANIANSIVF